MTRKLEDVPRPEAAVVPRKLRRSRPQPIPPEHGNARSLESVVAVVGVVDPERKNVWDGRIGKRRVENASTWSLGQRRSKYPVVFPAPRDESRLVCSANDPPRDARRLQEDQIGVKPRCLIASMDFGVGIDRPMSLERRTRSNPRCRFRAANRAENSPLRPTRRPNLALISIIFANSRRSDIRRLGESMIDSIGRVAETRQPPLGVTKNFCVLAMARSPQDPTGRPSETPKMEWAQSSISAIPRRSQNSRTRFIGCGMPK